MALIRTNTVGIDVYDFTGTKVLSTYAFEETPLTFVPNFTLNQLISTVNLVSPLTSYTLTDYVPDTNTYSNVKLRWDFDDGTYSIAPTAVHSFKFPGEYKVSLYLINDKGQSYKTALQATVNVYNYLTDDVYFDRPLDFVIDIPAGRLSDKITLKRINSYQSYQALSGTGYTFNLYASGTGSYYYDVKNYYKDKWGHLKKFYKFIKKTTIENVLQDEVIDRITTSSGKIYVKKTRSGLTSCSSKEKDAIFAGTSGSAEFYYTDDSNKNNISDSPPIIVFASLDLSKFYDFLGYSRQMYDVLTPLELSYLNFKPAVLPIVKTRYNPASQLTITSNGLDGEGSEIINSFNLNNISFANTKIPFVIKLKDQFNFTTKSYPYLTATNNFPTSSYQVKTVLISNSGTLVPSVSFYATDFENEIFKSGGFYRGYFICPQTVLNAKLSSVVYIDDIPNFEEDTIFLLYSQPYTHYLGKYYSNYFYSGCKKEPSNINNVYEFVDTVDCRSIFTITQIPSSNSNELDYSFWAGDTDNDKLVKFDYTGKLLTTVNLSALTSAFNLNLSGINLLNSWGSAVPSCIALDKDNKIWVTLFDSGSVIKLNQQGLLERVILPPVTLNYISSSDYNTFYGYAGENNVTPSYVDVDKDNNIYVVYSNPVFPSLRKYSSTGQLITSYNFSIYELSPQKIIVDRNNDLWVTVHNELQQSSNIENRNDYVYKFDKNLNLLFSISGIKMPGDITVDGNQNCWVTDGKTNLTKIYNNGSSKLTIMVGSYFNLTNYIQSIEGISCNSYNQIVVLNNIDLKIYFVDASTTTQPILSTIPYVDLVSAPTNFYFYPLSNFFDSKYQADGDFLGYKWINKNFYFAKNTKYISGNSVPFNIYSEKGNNLLFKKNENFNGETFYKNLALMQTLQDNPGFFNNFLGSIAGRENSNIDSSLLKRIYEKIANYKDNIADIDTCNIESLVSKCEMFNVLYKNFKYPYPSSIRRIIDLCSIKRNKILGTKNSFDLQFKYNVNLGDILTLETATFSGSELLVAKEKFSSTYKLVNTCLIPGIKSNDTVLLSTFNYNWGWNLVIPSSLSGVEIGAYYEFYRYKELSEDVFYENLLDFLNKNSNIVNNLSSLSSFSDWYGDNGVIDQNVAYTFAKGLRLFTSATNVYNN